jgi:hypothetical protein
MKFVCSTHGVVKPTKIYQSCPIVAECPICGETITEASGKCAGDE